MCPVLTPIVERMITPRHISALACLACVLHSVGAHTDECDTDLIMEKYIRDPATFGDALKDKYCWDGTMLNANHYGDWTSTGDSSSASACLRSCVGKGKSKCIAWTWEYEYKQIIKGHNCYLRTSICSKHMCGFSKIGNPIRVADPTTTQVPVEIASIEVIIIPTSHADQTYTFSVVTTAPHDLQEGSVFSLTGPFFETASCNNFYLINSETPMYMVTDSAATEVFQFQAFGIEYNLATCQPTSVTPSSTKAHLVAVDSPLYRYTSGHTNLVPPDFYQDYTHHDPGTVNQYLHSSDLSTTTTTATTTTTVTSTTTTSVTSTTTKTTTTVTTITTITTTTTTITTTTYTGGSTLPVTRPAGEVHVQPISDTNLFRILDTEITFNRCDVIHIDGQQLGTTTAMIKDVVLSKIDNDRTMYKINNVFYRSNLNNPTEVHSYVTVPYSAGNNVQVLNASTITGVHMASRCLRSGDRIKISSTTGVVKTVDTDNNVIFENTPFLNLMGGHNAASVEVDSYPVKCRAIYKTDVGLKVSSTGCNPARCDKLIFQDDSPVSSVTGLLKQQNGFPIIKCVPNDTLADGQTYEFTISGSVDIGATFYPGKTYVQIVAYAQYCIEVGDTMSTFANVSDEPFSTVIESLSNDTIHVNIDTHYPAPPGPGIVNYVTVATKRYPAPDEPDSTTGVPTTAQAPSEPPLPEKRFPHLVWTLIGLMGLSVVMFACVAWCSGHTHFATPAQYKPLTFYTNYFNSK